MPRGGKPLNWEKIKEKLIREFCLRTWNIWEKFGMHITPDHYYWPIPNTNELISYGFNKVFPLAGIDMDDPSMLTLLENIRKYRKDYAKIYTASGYESNGDGSILYGMIRELKPKRVVEVGSGFSTRVVWMALEKNRIEGCPGEIISIEPNPKKILTDLVIEKDNVSLVEERVEKLGLDYFEKLYPIDILFIDSSHNIKCANDVYFLYLQLLPQIPVGTVIHIHDIRFPQEYPKDWLLGAKKFWDEQYLLQMFLSYNESFRVVFAANYLYQKHPQLMEESLVGLSNNNDGWPGCFWLKRIK